MKKMGLFAIGAIVFAAYIMPALNQIIINFLVAGIIPGTNAKVSPYVIFAVSAVGLLFVAQLIRKVARAIPKLKKHTEQLVEDLEITSSTSS